MLLLTINVFPISLYYTPVIFRAFPSAICTCLAEVCLPLVTLLPFLWTRLIIKYLAYTSVCLPKIFPQKYLPNPPIVHQVFFVIRSFACIKSSIAQTDFLWWQPFCTCTVLYLEHILITREEFMSKLGSNIHKWKYCRWCLPSIRVHVDSACLSCHVT